MFSLNLMAVSCEQKQPYSALSVQACSHTLNKIEGPVFGLHIIPTPKWCHHRIEVEYTL